MAINGALGMFIWRIENFSGTKDRKLYSEIFNVGGKKWRLLMFPRGNKVDYLSIYLGVSDSATLPSGWSRYARFRLAVIDQTDPKTSVAKETAHVYKAKEVNWGFTSFLALSELHNPKRGYLINDACLVEIVVCTDSTIDLEAAIDNQETIIAKPVEITTAPAIVAAPDVLFSPGQDKVEPTTQNLPTAQTSSKIEAIEPEEPTEEDMVTFFACLESELRSSNIVSCQEAKEALAELEKALNMAPANFYDSSNFSPVKQAFKILASFDCSSAFTIEQKNELLAMEEKLKELAGRAVKAVLDKNLLSAKESVKLTITRNLESRLIRFKAAEKEVKHVGQKLAALHEQVSEAQKNRENILAEQKEIFRSSQELKMEMEALGKEWPEYEAKAKVAEEEEKTVEAEWGRMKDFISSIEGQI